jgi:hypothetical protein
MTNNFSDTLELNGVHAMEMLAHMLAHFKQKKAAKWNLAAFCDPAGMFIVFYNIHKMNDLVNTKNDLVNIWKTLKYFLNTLVNKTCSIYCTLIAVSTYI